MIICTVTCNDNLHEAKAMAKSVKARMPDAATVVCLVERTVHPDAERCPWFDRIVLAQDVGIPDFHRFLFKYNIMEGATAVKPYFLLHLFGIFPDERHVVFLDADVQALRPFDELAQAMDIHDIVLTAQQLERERAWYKEHFYKGVYNTAVMGFARSDEAFRFLRWWGERLYDYCFADEIHFNDQKWLDLAPALFNVHVFKHPGYNAAAWNLHERCRQVDAVRDGGFFLQGVPLCCFHFAGYAHYLWWHLVGEPAHPLYELAEGYVRELREMGEARYVDEPWSYDVFESGEPISDAVRHRFGRSGELRGRFDNPYAASNADFGS